MQIYFNFLLHIDFRGKSKFIQKYVIKTIRTLMQMWFSIVLKGQNNGSIADNLFTSNFAQWRYSNQWSYREMELLLVENWYQYPGYLRWNICKYANFCRLHSDHICRCCPAQGELIPFFSPFLRILRLCQNGFNKGSCVILKCIVAIQPNQGNSHNL